MQPFISKDPPIISVIDKEGKLDHFLKHKLVENKKIFLRVYAQCEKYDSVYLYRFDINFGIVDEYRNILLHASPDHGASGINTIDGINTVFRTIVEDAVANYLSANMQKLN